MKNAVGLIFAISASICFGFLGIFAKVGYDSGSNPTTVLIARFLIAAVALFFIILLSRKSLRVNKKQFIYLIVMSVIGYTLTTQTLFLSYEYIGVGLATGLHFIYPLCVCVFGFLFSGERFTKRKKIAIAISIAGVFFLSASGKGGMDIRGIILALTSGVLYGATVFIMGKDEIKKLDGRVTTFYCSLFAGITTLFIGLATHKITLVFNGGIALSYIGIAVVSTLLSLVFLQIAIKDIGASNSSILGTFEPIVGIIASAIFFGESIGILTVVGMAGIVVSVILIATAKKEERQYEMA